MGVTTRGGMERVGERVWATSGARASASAGAGVGGVEGDGASYNTEEAKRGGVVGGPRVKNTAGYGMRGSVTAAKRKAVETPALRGTGKTACRRAAAPATDVHSIPVSARTQPRPPLTKLTDDNEV